MTLHNLLHTLGSDDPAERIAAIQAIEEGGFSQAAADLVRVMHDDLDTGVRYQATRTLAVFADPATTDDLLRALRTDDMWLRVMAIDALIRIGQPAADGLIEALRDENHAVRRAAAKALGKIGAADAVRGLDAALLDADADVRRFAAEALGRIGDAGMVDGLGAALRDEQRRVREAAARALYHIGEPAIPALLAALEDPNPDVGMTAIFTLRSMDYQPPEA